MYPGPKYDVAALLRCPSLMVTCCQPTEGKCNRRSTRDLLTNSQWVSRIHVKVEWELFRQLDRGLNHPVID